MKSDERQKDAHKLSTTNKTLVHWKKSGQKKPTEAKIIHTVESFKFVGSKLMESSSFCLFV